jgi:hypothetical protein
MSRHTAAPNDANLGLHVAQLGRQLGAQRVAAEARCAPTPHAALHGEPIASEERRTYHE